MVKIPVVLAFTPNYIVPAATTILSILDSSSACGFHIICLLTEELSGEQQSLLRAIDSHRLMYSFIDLSRRKLDIYVDERYTIAASYRLLLPELLPEYDKVIYIDSDIIVRQDLGRLFAEKNMQDYYLAGVYEATLPFQEEYIYGLGLQPGNYINSGFLLMNLKKLREDGMVSRFLEASQKDGLQFPDQDVINQLCQGKILALSPVYNSIRTFFLPQYKKDFLRYYTEEEWDNVQQYGNIHYTGGKPWNEVVVHFETWWSYYDRLSEGLRAMATVDSKIYFLSRVLKIKGLRNIKDFVLKLYRKLKYRVN